MKMKRLFCTACCYVIVRSRDWCNPVLLKKLDEDVLGLNLSVWDPRVGFCIWEGGGGGVE